MTYFLEEIDLAKVVGIFFGIIIFLSGLLLFTTTKDIKGMLITAIGFIIIIGVWKGTTDLEMNYFSALES